MAMEYDTDLKVYIETETEYQSLYKWCIKEENKNGDQVGRDLIPYNWNVYFHSTSFGIERSISSKSRFIIKDGDIKPLTFDKTDAIFAKLTTGHYEDNWRAPSIAMIGSSRKVNDITLRIQPIDNVEKETCHVWGTVAYEFEVDFRNERTEDTIQISFFLERKKFDSLFDLISKNEIDRLAVRLSSVQGFYSDWSPAVSTDSIKVLANLTDHGLEVEEDWKKRIPTLGEVGEASITVHRSQTATTSQKPADGYSDNWQDEGDDITPDPAVAKPPRSQGELRHKFYERALSRITKLLGILILIELFRAISH